MPTKFIESLGGKLAERWSAALLTPAFVFWLGGLAAFLWRFGWNRLANWLTGQSESIQIALLVVSLLVVAASAFVVQLFELPVIKFLEGYWPSWMRPLRRLLLQRQRYWLRQKEQRWQNLATQQDKQSLTPEEMDEFVALDWQLRQFSARPERLMPTRLGNLLRAAEEQPLNKYGLDAVICWPRLWLVLPDDVRKELQESRSELNSAARIWLWGLLFLVWTMWTPWAIIVALLCAMFAYRWMLSATETYADLLESAFDLHRTALYQSLRWPLPANPAEELQMGRQLTEYLWRGSNQTKPDFTNSN
ncbi:MAG: hypothetical protein AB1589_32660 [Cyanobacteriota bacterium]